jgi:hypothetical protein
MWSSQCHFFVFRFNVSPLQLPSSFYSSYTCSKHCHKYVVSTFGRAFNDSSYYSHIRYHMHHLQFKQVSHQPQILRVRIAPLDGKCNEFSLSLQVFLLPWVFFSPAQVPAKSYQMTSIDSFESIFRCNGSPTWFACWIPSWLWRSGKL